MSDIKCTSCGSNTILYPFGHKYAGIWECMNLKCGASGDCNHTNYSIESVELFPGSVHETQVYVCNACGITLDGDPAADRADAIADMQIMEALGK